MIIKPLTCVRQILISYFVNFLNISSIISSFDFFDSIFHLDFSPNLSLLATIRKKYWSKGNFPQRRPLSVSQRDQERFHFLFQLPLLILQLPDLYCLHAINLLEFSHSFLEFSDA